MIDGWLVIAELIVLLLNLMTVWMNIKLLTEQKKHKLLES